MSKWGAIVLVTVLLLWVFGLIGCATKPPERPLPPPRIETQIVEVPVVTRCGASEKIGPEPDYAATDAKILDVPHKGPVDLLSDQEVIENLYDVVNKLSLDRLQRIRRDSIKSQAIASC